MMKASRLLPVWALVLVLLIGVTAMGLGYALWSDSIVIDGTAKTGTVDIRWVSDVVSDGDGHDGPGTCNRVLTSSGDLLTVTVGSAYPMYECSVEADILNAGTLPVVTDWDGAFSGGESGEYSWNLTMAAGPFDPSLAVGATLEGSFTVKIAGEATAQGTTYTLDVPEVVYSLPTNFSGDPAQG